MIKDLVWIFWYLPYFLWEKDPGYFKLKHALKTIIGIFVSMLLAYNHPSIGKLMAGVACGVSMQGIIAKSFWRRVGQILFFNSLYFFVFLAGLLVRDNVTQTAVLLTGMAFFVNYIRRFDLQTSLAPTMAWLLCFMATVLPFKNPGVAFPDVHGLLIGLGVSTVMVLFIFPENYQRLFVDNTGRIFKILYFGMKEIRIHVLGIKKRRYFDDYFFNYGQISLFRLIDSNQSIEDSQVFDDKQGKVTEIMIHLYAFINAYQMMIDAYKTLMNESHYFSYPIRMALSQATKSCMELLSQLEFQENSLQFKSEIDYIPLIKLTEKLQQKVLHDPVLVIALLNIKLAFILFNQHAGKLLRMSHETH